MIHTRIGNAGLTHTRGGNPGTNPGCPLTTVRRKPDGNSHGLRTAWGRKTFIKVEKPYLAT